MANQSFLLAINDALAKANLQHLLPATYFDSAISIIKKWETNFPEAYKKLVQELKKKKINVEDLLVGLCRFDQEAYSAFCDCYPQIAAGTAFNPMTNMDVVKLYQSVVDALVEQTEYSGINIIFDEFSKFLESNIDKSKMLNFKIIQDVAELASRSGKKQIHFTCITHKEILDYSSSDSFKTVEGRFKHIKFVASSEQSYELISNAIVKDASFAAFKKSHQATFVEVCNKSSLIDVFSDLTPDSLEEKLLYGCFPLTPLSAYALLNISELVGQNERTLFTFLAQDGEFTFQDFLKKEHEAIEFITPDYIYTYFEELFRNLYASWGIGGFVSASAAHLTTALAGGTGSDSLNLNMAWHQDHIHPRYAFEKNRLIKYFAEKGLKLDDITLKEWAAKSNTLVNLQLLTGKQNQEKSKSPLVTWIYNQFPDDDKRKKYCEEHYIDFDAGFELENFDAYYNRRREELKKKLMEIFSVQVISEEETRIIEEQTSEEESVITPEGKTIAEVAVSVLIDHPEGLTCKQIYEAIMEQHLYEFKAENPEVVLRIEIRRRCQNVDISKSYETKCFRIVKEVDGECYYGITFSD